MSASRRVRFAGANGYELAARLDLPVGKPRAYALFAHCFTCSKDLAAARNISRELSQQGIGVLRFDFTGLGHSDGEFAKTNFSSNIADLIAAADYMRANLEAPAILVGHSLGGAAVLAAAVEIREVKAVATIGAPADVGHVLHQFGSSLEQVRSEGKADVSLGGRTFTIEKQFVEDAEGQNLESAIASMRKPLLVLHAPKDEVVGIDNAGKIFAAAKHPKSFISLDGADHLLTRPEDAAYAGHIIAAWAAHVLPAAAAADEGAEEVVVTETGAGRFQSSVRSGQHRLITDEPKAAGGLDSGPSPYDYLSIALGACTTMTLRMYAERKNLNVGRISVAVNHGKVDAAHCEDCEGAAEGREGRIDRFERIISVDGEIAPEIADKLIEIAGKCPVHRTLEAGSAVVTRLAKSKSG